ncbi:MAG: hypothetical protein HKP08_11225, partial [Flavobacteriaceae bacterium]|nr:hypothetical protein [Flavobacteriaceae bacterium]
MIKQSIGALVLLALMSCSYDNSQDPALEINEFKGEVAWITSFGGSGDDTPRSVISTSDGGYAIFGFSNSTDGDLVGKTTNVNDYWLVRLDTDGTLLWSRTYGGSKDDRGQAVIETSD